jgi:hypothetical protein
MAGSRKVAIDIHFFVDQTSIKYDISKVPIFDVYRVVSKIPENKIDLCFHLDQNLPIPYMDIVTSLPKKGTNRFRVFIISKTQNVAILRKGCWVREWHDYICKIKDSNFFLVTGKMVKPKWFKLGKEIARTTVEEALDGVDLEKFNVYLDNSVEQVLIEKIRNFC